MEARLPLDKTAKCQTLISTFVRGKKVTLREMQSLLGLLNFRLIDLKKGVKFPHHFIRLNKSSKADLALWQSFLDDFNGRSFFLNDAWHDSLSLNLFTDAAGSCC